MRQRVNGYEAGRGLQVRTVPYPGRNLGTQARFKKQIELQSQQRLQSRQWVVTFPYELRGKLGFDSKLLSTLCGVVVDSILAFYERRMRDVLGPLSRFTVAEAPPLQDPDPEDGDPEEDDARASNSRQETRHPKARRRKLQSGTVTAVQRVSSDFRLNVHA